MKDTIELIDSIVTRWSNEDKEYARKLLGEIAVGLTKYERRELIETDRLEDEYSNYKNNEICEQRLREAK